MKPSIINNSITWLRLNPSASGSSGTLYAIFFFIFFYFIGILSTMAQGERTGISEIKVVKQNATSRPDNSEWARNQNGKVIGSYQLETKEDGSQKFAISIGGKSKIEVDPLSYLMISEPSNRIVTYGDDLWKHIAYDADIKIYNTNGNLIKSMDAVVQMPYTASVSEDGHLYVAGKKGETEAEAHNVFIKYDQDGNKLWDKQLPMAIVSQIHLSKDNQQIALVRFDDSFRKHHISFYDASGALLYNDESHGSFTSMEFLSNGNVVVVCGAQWFLYNLNSNYDLINSGTLSGNGIGIYPITEIASSQQFMVTSVAYPETNTGFNVAVYDSNNGSKVTEQVIPGEPHLCGYRIANVLANGNISLNLGLEQVEISIRN